MIEQSTHSRIDTLQSVELAEGVEVHARVAGLFPRAMAHLVDMLFVIVILIVTGLVVGGIAIALSFSEAAGQVLEGVWDLLMFGMVWFYFFFFERGKKAATFGKRIFGLKVVSVDGTKATSKQVVIRNLLRAADVLPGVVVAGAGFMVGSYGLGIIACLFTKKFQRVGDLVAGTIVVHSDAPNHTTMPLPPAPQAKLPRLPINREEEVAIRGFCERAGIWSDARRIEIANHASELTNKAGHEGLAELQAYSRSIAERK